MLKGKKIESLLLHMGIPMSVIFGYPSIFNAEPAPYYAYMGIVGLIMILLSFVLKYFKRSLRRDVNGK